MHSSGCGNVPLNVGEVIGVASSAHSESRPDTVRGLPAFASMLRVHRTGAGLTQEELAAAAGISTRSVSDLERGITRTAHRDTVRLLVAALGLDGDEAAAFAAVARGRAPRPDVSSRTGSVSPPTKSGLPVPPTALVGRAAVIDDVLSVLHRADVRVLTVTGPGGVGKTRVVLELAARWARDTGERATFVPLAHLRDAGLVLPTVAEAVGVRASGSVPSSTCWSSICTIVRRCWCSTTSSSCWDARRSSGRSSPTALC
jgi:transcriptional regulator with XRE-family HTH domain